MDAAARARAVELLGQFNDDMTAMMDGVFGTQWAEIEQMVALVVLVAETSPTTRRLSEVSGLDRRAVSRLVARMEDQGLVSTRRAVDDRRSIEVVLSPHGTTQAANLRAFTQAFFRAKGAIAREITAGLGAHDVSTVLGASGDPIDLLRRVCQAGATLVRAMPGPASRGQLAARQRAALVQIVSQSGVRPHEVAPSLDVSRAGAAYIIDQLVAKGFVVRRRGGVPGDRRAVVLEATMSGVQAVVAVADAIERERWTLAALFAEVALWSTPIGEPASSRSLRRAPSTPRSSA